MAQSHIIPVEVDEVRVTTVVDGVIDVLMAGTEVAERYMLGPKWLPVVGASPNPLGSMHLVAEHGFSALIKVNRGGSTSTALFDTGVSQSGLLNNLDALEIKAHDLQAIILSHGHADHSLGLPGLVQRLGARTCRWSSTRMRTWTAKLCCQTAMSSRCLLPGNRISNGTTRDYIEVIEETGPSMLVDGGILVSGEVARRTEFETGFANHYANRGGNWEPDPLIMDDQCAIMNLRGQGLVVITGCGHAGIINIIRNAQALTGIQTIHAVTGGFHLTGGLFEPIIPATVSALQEIGPRYIVPGHCTGWAATHRIAQAMPDAFIQHSVGTEFVFRAAG